MNHIKEFSSFLVSEMVTFNFDIQLLEVVEEVQSEMA